MLKKENRRSQNIESKKMIYITVGYNRELEMCWGQGENDKDKVKKSVQILVQFGNNKLLCQRFFPADS